MCLPWLDFYFQKVDHYLIYQTIQIQTSTVCSLKNFMSIDTSCCMKGITPSRRTWYTNGKTTAPEMFWKQHAENIFLEFMDWKVGSVKSGKIEASRHGRSRTLSNTIPVILQRRKWILSNAWIFWRTEVYMKAFGQWLGNWPERAQIGLRSCVIGHCCVCLINQ